MQRPMLVCTTRDRKRTRCRQGSEDVQASGYAPLRTPHNLVNEAGAFLRGDDWGSSRDCMRGL